MDRDGMADRRLAHELTDTKTERSPVYHEAHERTSALELSRG
jgi:hypothetical protein